MLDCFDSANGGLEGIVECYDTQVLISNKFWISFADQQLENFVRKVLGSKVSEKLCKYQIPCLYTRYLLDIKYVYLNLILNKYLILDINRHENQLAKLYLQQQKDIDSYDKQQRQKQVRLPKYQQNIRQEAPVNQVRFPNYQQNVRHQPRVNNTQRNIDSTNQVRLPNFQENNRQVQITISESSDTESDNQQQSRPQNVRKPNPGVNNRQRNDQQQNLQNRRNFRREEREYEPLQEKQQGRFGFDTKTYDIRYDNPPQNVRQQQRKGINVRLDKQQTQEAKVGFQPHHFPQLDYSQGQDEDIKEDYVRYDKNPYIVGSEVPESVQIVDSVSVFGDKSGGFVKTFSKDKEIHKQRRNIGNSVRKPGDINWYIPYNSPVQWKKKGRKCVICDKLGVRDFTILYGHLKSSCPFVRRSNILCFKCGRYGHHVTRCW